MDSSKRLASLLGNNKSLESKNADSSEGTFSKEGSPMNTITAAKLIPGTVDTMISNNDFKDTPIQIEPQLSTKKHEELTIIEEEENNNFII